MSTSPSTKVAVVGLGYVGLPLAIHFGRSVSTLGFDINPKRIESLTRGEDLNGEVSKVDLAIPFLRFSANPEDLADANAFIVAVPTPVDKANRPDLTPLIHASRLVGRALRSRRDGNEGNNTPPLVIYESTVYPGCTEEICLPILEEESQLLRGKAFKIGYSPERINPGDTEHTLDKVVKIVSGEDRETLERIAALYSVVAKAGVHRAPTIRTAEAAKVIENIQRDLNIALVNELSMLFHQIGLSTKDVLEAAGTKWNFLPFWPGLVGGHCIPVDPYYLTHKAEEIGFHPQVILAGRRVNDSMGKYVADQTVKLLIQTGAAVRNAKALVLGITFKEGVRDIRNSKVLDLINTLSSYGVHVEVYDPLVEAIAIKRLGFTATPDPFKNANRYAAVIVAVAHKEFLAQPGQRYVDLLQDNTGHSLIIDIKGALTGRIAEGKALYWSL
ncbi:MAG: nucleotide sugar dehydrogenase [Chloroflexi bacterium]|nr:nucleotide sugar dehydrogenase [Chloroflexota bacterium]